MSNLNIPIAQIKTFKVCGMRRNGKRFKTIKTSNYMHAMCINLWRGSVWAVLENGKSIRIKQVYN